MSFPRYAAYRESGVMWLGAVPAHWRVERLKRLASVSPSNVDKKVHDGQASVRLCNYTDVYYNDVISADMDFMEATASEDQIAKFTLRADDVIITKDSETADDIAIAAHVPEDLPGVVCGYHLSVIRPQRGTSGAFLKRLFDSVFVRSNVAIRANGLTRVGLSQYALDNLELPVPPVDEQHAIALFLEHETKKLDALITEQQQLIDLLAEKRQAVISHAVTKGFGSTTPLTASGVSWLGDVPAHWRVVPLRRCVDEHRQGYYSPQAYVDAGVKLVRITDLREYGTVDLSECPMVADDEDLTPFLLRSGDFVFARTGGAGSFGLVGAIAERLVYASYLIRFRFTDALLPEFLRFYFWSSVFQDALSSNIHGGVNQNVHAEDIKNQYIAIPPHHEQEAISAELTARTTELDELAAEAECAIAILRERRRALISAAVCGKIDVRGLVDAEVSDTADMVAA